MSTAVDRRWLGYVSICMLAVICLLANLLLPVLSVTAQQIQLRALSIAIDLYVIGYMFWGIALIQPALLSIFLAYGRPSFLFRVPLGLFAFAICYVAYFVGCLVAGGPPFEFVNQVMLLIGIQTVGFSFSMWATRVMRGWQLVGLEVRETRVAPPVHRGEFVVECVSLILLVAAAIVLPDVILTESVAGVGVIAFAAIALVGTVVLAPIVFVCLRSSNFLVINSFFVALIVGAAAVAFGIIYFVYAGALQSQYTGPMAAAATAGGMLAGFLGSLRLAGYQLRERPFYKVKAKTRGVPRDPFED